ncbi:MAG: RNA polymerase sigma factor [Acidobacteria bacterium]|nr:RNA polymerase sigma factor [Acidobacteriota bacterium]MCB9398115.1 RNA polymerase sigma factor [Acidobacteriota bacterium]
MLQETSEKDQIELARAEPKAFGPLYDRYFDPIFNYCLHRLGSVVEAEDITAQTFAKALANLRFFKWKGISFGAWLYRIATNEMQSYLRKGRITYVDPAQMSIVEPRNPHSELEELEQELAEFETFRVLQRCLGQLKPRDQALITLHYFENKTFSECAEILGVRTGTLIMRCRRALEKLKFVMEKKGVRYEGFGTLPEGNPQTATFS